MRVSDHLRGLKAQIGTRWEAALREACPRLGELDRAALIDHLPEVLDGLAAWVEGDQGRAHDAFEALAVGHALQRLGHGVDLDTLAIEYQVLRSQILQELLAVEIAGDLRRDLLRLNEGLDEAVLQAIRRYVAARDEVRDRFIGILGHDVRGPLQVAQMAFERLAHTEPDDDVPLLAARGLRAIGRIDRMTRDVLDFAHSHLGNGIPVTPTEQDLGAICTAVVEDARATHPTRAIELEVTGDLRGFWDRDRVVQALGNLIGNALEHGRDPIRITARDEDRFVVTDIANRGPEVPPELVRRMFEPFQRSPGSQGLGLGLFIARAIAAAHGAICHMTSQPDLTTFHIVWPRARPEEVPGRP